MQQHVRPGLKSLIHKFSFQEKDLLEIEGPLVILADENKMSKMLIHYCFERPVFIAGSSDIISDSDKDKAILFVGGSDLLSQLLKESSEIEGRQERTFFSRAKIFKLRLSEKLIEKRYKNNIKR